jgi:hypothetical protein
MVMDQKIQNFQSVISKQIDPQTKDGLKLNNLHVLT